MSVGQAEAAVREAGGVRLLSTERTAPGEETLSRLRDIAGLPFVRGPVVALGDVHWKPRMETPSSTATATEGEIVLGLSSSSQNCGMTVLSTPFGAEEAGEHSFLVRLMTRIREAIPRSRREPIITRDEAIGFALGGAAAAGRRYGLDPAVLEGIEEGGSLFGPGGADRDELLSAVDEAALEKGRLSFAFIGGGNHFLEVQAVEEILDQEACRALGIAPGRIMVMFHTGSERFGSDLGRLYSVRLKTSPNRRRKYFFRKIPLHLMRGRPGLSSAAARMGYFFSRRPYVPVPADSPDGRRLALTLKAAGNYGYANRVAVLDLILRAMKETAGGGTEGFRVVADLSHNVIAREAVDGRELWVHRHNSVRLRPPSAFPEGSLYRRIGQPSMLPGTNRSSSYILLSREGTARTLNSADHGAGRTVELFEERGWCRPRPERRTLKFGYGSPAPEIVTHVSDEGIEEVVSLLARNGVAVPAARLRPLAVLKG
ncbi:MAG TPA: RtcB family protein [Candidatus Saccharimonadales bacterium]|nr:RtcB family protein [Candidatus Saccharimonadales bacterium]